MPDPSLSPAIIEARALCPTNVYEIETLEIRHPSLPLKKNKLQVCFIIDKFYASNEYKTTAERVIAQITEIKTELKKQYNKIRFSLMTVSGQEWEIQTGNNFVTFTEFNEALSSVVFEDNAESNQIYNPIRDAVSDLNWKGSNSLVAKHIFYIGDSPNITNTTLDIDWEGELRFGRFSSSPIRLRIEFYTGGVRQNPIALGFQNYGQNLTISQIQNIYYPTYPSPSGILWQTTFYNRDYQIRNNVGSGQETTHIYLDNTDGSAVAPTNTLGLSLGMLGSFRQPLKDTAPESHKSGPFPHPVNARVTGTHLISSEDTATLALAIEDLESKNIIFNQLPTFVNANLTSIVTATGGVSLSYAQLSTNESVVENIVNALSLEELIESEIEKIYIVNDTQNHLLPIETSEEINFISRGFKLRFTGSGENGLQNLSITIDDIDRKVSKFVALAKSFSTPVELVFRVYLSDDLSQQQNNPPTVLYLTSTSNSVEGFSGNATTIDVVNAPFPNAYYRLENFPLA